MKNEYGVDLTMGEALEALVSVWDEGFWKAAEPVREWTPGSDKGEMKIEYGVELTMAEVVEALVSVWEEERFNAAEPVREWTPGSDDDRNPFGEFKEEAK